MDRIEAMRVFVRVVERRSFVSAARDLLLPRSRVSEAVQQLEQRLGVRLLNRTTRQVTPTAEGEDYCRRCLTILADIDDAEASVGGTQPAGPLRVDLHGTLARHFLLPDIAEFLQAYPDIQLHIGEGDRLVDLVREGIDCVVRVGEPKDSGLVGRRLGYLDEGTFASPNYLERHGVPASPDDLGGHCMIGFLSSATGALIPFEFQVDGEVRFVTLPASVTVASAATNACLANHGLGLIQVPRYRVAHELATGVLVEVLAETPPTPSPVSILFPEGRQLSPHVRVFIDWVASTFETKVSAMPK